MDPIADMFSAIKNAIQRRMDYVDIPSSKMKERILEILKKEGYIKDWERIEDAKKGYQYTLRIHLRYLDHKKSKSAIRELGRISKLGRRVYTSARNIPYIQKGLGIAILSTDAGVITDHEARKLKKGGEIIAYVL